MELQELKATLKKKLVEVEEKLKEVDDALTKQNNEPAELKEAHEALKRRRDEIILEYDQIAALNSEEEVRLPELEKNIFNSLDSFDTAYQNAGGLIKENRFRDRNHRIDFKDPQNTL